MKFGDLLKEARLSTKDYKSLEFWASKIKTSRQSLHRWESCEVLPNAVKIRKILELYPPKYREHLKRLWECEKLLKG